MTLIQQFLRVAFVIYYDITNLIFNKSGENMILFLLWAKVPGDIRVSNIRTIKIQTTSLGDQSDVDKKQRASYDQFLEKQVYE